MPADAGQPGAGGQSGAVGQAGATAQAGAAGDAGSGQAGSTGQGGSAEPSTWDDVCHNGGQLNGVIVPIAVAIPSDFLTDPPTTAAHQHKLIVLRKDYFDGVTTLQTEGTADHQHVVNLTPEQLSGFGSSRSTTVVSEPAAGSAGDHTHTIMLHACGLPG